MLKRISILAVCALVLSMAAPVSATVASAETIVRSDLEPGHQLLVGDEAIELANSATMAVARGQWDSDSNFVAQIDYQLVFRSNVDFMSADPSHIAQLLDERPVNMGSQSMGLYMSDNEVAEMVRRDNVGDRMPLITQAVVGDSDVESEEGRLPDYGPNFGGIWQDQRDGGRIVLAVVDASELDLKNLRDLAGGESVLRIVEQPFSYNEIEEYRAQLNSELDKLGLLRDVAAVRSDAGRLLEVRVEDPGAIPKDFGSAVPEGAYRVVQGPVVVPATSPTSTHALADQQPGLQIYVYDGGGAEPCTWGFNGHTNTYHYVVMAGHCLRDHDNESGDLVTGIDIWQNNQSSREITASQVYVKSIDNSKFDVSRVSSSYANDNCYHGDNDISSPSPHCAWPMTYRALHNSWEIGSDRSCASLAMTNDYRCGYVVEENFGGNRARVDLVGNLGDSGSGFKWDYRIDGVLTDIVTGGGSGVFIQTAYDTQRVLGNGYFYFNCAVGETTTSNPSSWGVCPSQDA